MKRLQLAYALMTVPMCAMAQESKTPPTQLTIYNDNFAIVRTTVPLELRPGVTAAETTNVTAQVEPDSVILRDPAGKRPIHVLEQSYDAGVISQELLLRKYEGQELEFQINPPQTYVDGTGTHKMSPAITEKATVIRASTPGTQPVVEVDGKLEFQLPGMPIFPLAADNLLLKPTLKWQIESADAARVPAELDYMTGGLSWQAAYNVVLPESAALTPEEKAEVIGWVTIQNESGTAFEKASVQLMAGDVAKIRNGVMGGMAMGRGYSMMAMDAAAAPPAATQKAFDDFHLYDLHRTLSLNNHETKQVQFLDIPGVTVQRAYEFDGNDAATQPFYPGTHYDSRNFGTSNTKVSVEEEIRNTETNHLGMPLPAGRLRLYRREASGQLQFVGESMVPHTAAEQSLHITSGKAFDVTAMRKQTDFHVDGQARNMDETFEIKISNAKSAPALVHDVEHLNRAENWQIAEKSTDYTKRDSATIDFPVTVPAKGEVTVRYTVHYTW